MSEWVEEPIQGEILYYDKVTFVRGGRQILRGVNWQIKNGQRWALLGRNGAGKSTLLSMIPAYTFPTRGTMRVLGYTFGKYAWKNIKERVGFVSSSLAAFAGTLASEPLWKVVLSGEGNTIGIYQEMTEEAKTKALAIVHAFHLDYVAEAEFGRLSTGEQRRTLLARAFMAEPDLLIFDEPCNGLDVPAREEFLRTVEEQSEQGDLPPFVYVTHTIEEIVPAVTHVAMLKDGQIMAAGPKKDLLTDKYLTDLYDWPVHVLWENNRPWLIVK